MDEEEEMKKFEMEGNEEKEEEKKKTRYRSALRALNSFKCTKLRKI